MAEQQSGSGAERDPRAERGMSRVARHAHAHFKWRTTLRSRLFVGAVIFGAVDRGHSGPPGLSAGSRARRHAGSCRSAAPADPDCAGQARRDRRPQRQRPRLQRGRRQRVRRSVGDREPRQGRAAGVRGARRMRTARAAGDGAEPPPRLAVRLSGAQAVARRSAAGEGAGAERRRPSSRRAGATTRRRSSRLTCSVTSASTTPGWPASSRPTTRRFAAREGKILVQTDARRHALSSRVDRPATAGVALELTIDQYLQHIAERELRAGVEANNAAGGTARDHGPEHRRDPRARQLADLQPERVQRAPTIAAAATGRFRISTSRGRPSRSSRRRRRSRKGSSTPRI